ncbi:MAG TPA: phosphodiester glycosidase family protein [Verrucomicrobiae bacterium]|nr:phosphodiester glycosidase family protein [Verrucomicrobiae bacterium]
MKQLMLYFICLGVIVAARISAFGQTVTNCQLPGIICLLEIQTNPPQRLFIARIDLTNPRLQVRVSPGGPDPDGAGQWETTLMQPTAVAKREHFSLVVNGDFFLAKNVRDAEGKEAGYRPGQWARPEGPAMTDGQTWSRSAKPHPCLVIHKDGTIAIESLSDPNDKDWEVVGGGPILLRDGAVAAPPARPGRHDNYKARNPRTAAGIDANGTTLTLLVVDGRQAGIATGMTFNELATEMLRLGCKDAINLDGGGSSVMAVREAKTGSMKILNEPSDGRERAVADVLGITLDRAIDRSF